MHIELIRNHERLHRSLGGSGYLPPSDVGATLADVQGAHRDALLNRATVAGTLVVKVDRSSVNWERPAKRRPLTFADGKCWGEATGGTRGWWFVSIEVDSTPHS